jgi:hypothetical protein
MKKKIALACALLLSNSAFSGVSTTVYVQPLTHAIPNVPYYISTGHTYYVQNDSGIVQNVAVCMTTVLCYNAAPQYKKILQSCDRFVLQPGEIRNRANNTTLPFNYPFSGYCDVAATTESFGWQHSLASKNGKLKVAPN